VKRKQIPICLSDEARPKKAVKDAQTVLMRRCLPSIQSLSEDEIEDVRRQGATWRMIHCARNRSGDLLRYESATPDERQREPVSAVRRGGYACLLL